MSELGEIKIRCVNGSNDRLSDGSHVRFVKMIFWVGKQTERVISVGFCCDLKV